MAARRTDPCEIEDEAALVRKAQADRTAFACLYATYLGPVLRYCSRRLADPAAAEDATAHIFAQALAHIESCQPASFRSWLFAIARNVVTDSYRRSRPSASLDVAAEMIDPDPSPEEIAIADEERRRLDSLLVQLTRDQRRVVELRLAGLTGAEIALALGLSHSAVKVHQFRAIRRLRTALGIAAPSGDPGTERTEP
jgi:RNA polymerase sigma-70 factor (ECF subfamily)